MKVDVIGAKEVETLTDSVAITDTTVRAFSDVLKPETKSVVIFVYSTLDQPVNIALRDAGDVILSNTFYKKIDGTSQFTITVPANPAGTVVITPEDWPPLRYLKRLSLRVNCSVAPTTGSLTIKETYQNK